MSYLDPGFEKYLEGLDWYQRMIASQKAAFEKRNPGKSEVSQYDNNWNYGSDEAKSYAQSQYDYDIETKKQSIDYGPLLGSTSNPQDRPVRSVGEKIYADMTRQQQLNELARMLKGWT